MLWDTVVHKDLLRMTPKANETKAKTENWDHIKQKSKCNNQQPEEKNYTREESIFKLHI